jgi:hypothetical protein
MDSNWQSRVIQRFGFNFTFFNPRDHQLNNSKQYTEWDLFYIQKADILFAYMEQENPSGFGLTLEVGFARALSKSIILVDEKSGTDDFFKSKFQIVRNSASVTLDDLNEGLDFLESFLRTKNSNLT